MYFNSPQTKLLMYVLLRLHYNYNGLKQHSLRNLVKSNALLCNDNNFLTLKLIIFRASRIKSYD